MATVTKWIAAPVEDVWAILADPAGYAFWVVGSHDVRYVDGVWPEVGATFHHTQGHGPVKIKDTTTVVEIEPRRRLLLEVRIRPFLTGPVELTLEPSDGGTSLSIEERAEGGFGGLVPNLFTSPLIAMRNAEALRRLAGMAWARAAVQGHVVPTPQRASTSSSGVVA
jgi:uncharacterized protein YndB with AHSA1/START domain